MNKTLKTIEFDKVLEILSGFAVSKLGKKRCLEVLPLVDADEIKLAQTLTTQAQNAYRLSASSIPVSGREDITDALSLLKNKITLCVEDVKNIGGSGYVVQKDKRVLDQYLR